MPNLRAVMAAALLLAATSALAQETSPPSPGAAEPGLSFRMVDDSADAAAHAGEAQAGFKDRTLWLESEAPITGRMVAASSSAAAMTARRFGMRRSPQRPQARPWP